MTDELTPAPPDSPPTRPGPPPLRIHHLLICTVVAAALLARVHGSRTSGIHWGNTEADWVLIAASEVIRSVGITLALFSLYWWKKGFAAFSQPGQWLLIPFAWNLIVPWAFMLLCAAFRLGSFHEKGFSLWVLNDLPEGLGWFYRIVIDGIVPAAFYIVIVARRAADTRPWRVFYLIMAIGVSWMAFAEAMVDAATVMGCQPQDILGLLTAHLTPGTSRFVFDIFPRYVIAPMTLIWACSDDQFCRRPRYWTHWAGAILTICGTLISLGRTIGMQ